MEFRHMSKDSLIYFRPTIPIATISKLFLFCEIVNTVLNYTVLSFKLHFDEYFLFLSRSFGSSKLLFKRVYLILAQIPSYPVVTYQCQHHLIFVWFSSVQRPSV